MSQANLQLVRRLFAAVAARDEDAVIALYAPDVEWDGSRSRWAEVLPGEGRYTGHDGIREFSRQYYEMWTSFEDRIEELIDVREHEVVSVVTSRGRGRASGLEVELPGHSAIWTIRDERVVRVVWYPTRSEVLRAVGLHE